MKFKQCKATKDAQNTLVTINNSTPGFKPSVPSLMIKFRQKKYQSCWFTILWQSYGVILSSMGGENSVNLKLAKTFCAQKAGTHEIKGLTKAGICTIFAQSVIRCTGIYPIILDFWNVQRALITHIFLSITWSPSYCRYWVSINLAVKRHTFFSPDIVLILKSDIWRI